MEVESQTKPLDPKQPQPKLKTTRSRRKRNICFIVIAVLLAIGLLFLILGLTVFRTKRPVITMNSVSLSNFEVGLNIPRLRVDLNVTFDINMSIRNRNKIGMSYRNTSALMRYRGEVVGEVPLPAGRMGADSTTTLNVTLTLIADRLIANSDFYADVIAGSIPMTTSTRIAGRVRIIFPIRLVSYTTCEMVMSVPNRNITSQVCRYRTKL